MINITKRLSYSKSIKDIIFTPKYDLTRDEYEVCIRDYYSYHREKDLVADFWDVIGSLDDFYNTDIQIKEPPMNFHNRILGFVHVMYQKIDHVLSTPGIADYPEVPNNLKEVAAILVTLSLSREEIVNDDDSSLDICFMQFLDFFNCLVGSGDTTTSDLVWYAKKIGCATIASLVNHPSKDKIDPLSQFGADMIAVIDMINNYYDGNSTALVYEELCKNYIPYMRNRIMESAIYDAYKDDFAWEAQGIDGMIPMMDHITYAFNAFPKDVKELTQEIINNYVDDLTRYVITHSVSLNKSTVLLYVRDILNLIVPRVSQFPDIRMYVDAAINRGYIPSTNSSPNVEDITVTKSIMIAKESADYDERYAAVMEAIRKKTQEEEPKDEEDSEDDDGDIQRKGAREPDDLGSGSDIQRQKKKTATKEMAGASRKIYGAFKTAQAKAGVIDSSISAITRGLKTCLVGDTRTAIIEGKKITPIEALVRVLGTAAIFRFNKVAGLIAIVVQYALKKTTLRSERKKIILELEQELEIIEEKIEDAKGDGNKQAKYALMRTRNDLKTAISKIRYGLEASDKSSDTAIGVLKDARRS